MLAFAICTWRSQTSSLWFHTGQTQSRSFRRMESNRWFERMKRKRGKLDSSHPYFCKGVGSQPANCHSFNPIKDIGIWFWAWPENVSLLIKPHLEVMFKLIYRHVWLAPHHFVSLTYSVDEKRNFVEGMYGKRHVELMKWWSTNQSCWETHFVGVDMVMKYWADEMA